MKTRFGLLLFAFLLTAVILSGCKKNEQKLEETTRAEEVKPVDPNDPTDSPAPVTDAEITASVKAKLMQDESVAARRIDIDTEDGVVTLRGIVATDTEAARAVELAQTADGVRLVHSYLKTDTGEIQEEKAPANDSSQLKEDTEDVLNAAGEALETGMEQAQDVGSDAAITAQIKWKLAKDKLVQAADIEVDTKNRRVTLTGIVASKQEAQRAMQIAQSIEDVVEVDSNIRVR